MKEFLDVFLDISSDAVLVLLAEAIIEPKILTFSIFSFIRTLEEEKRIPCGKNHHNKKAENRIKTGIKPIRFTSIQKRKKLRYTYSLLKPYISRT